MKTFNTDKLILAVDSHYGQYMFPTLLERFEWNVPEHLQSDFKIVKREIFDNEWFWQAVDNLTNEITTEINGEKYVPLWNEDLWLIPENMEVDENWII